MKRQWIRMLALSLALPLVGCGADYGNNNSNESSTNDGTFQTEIVVSEVEESMNETTPSEPSHAVMSSTVSIPEETEITTAETVATTVNAAEVEKEEEERKRAEEEEQRKKEEEQRKAEESRKKEEEKKLADQRNFSMMYYLAITSEEIRTSKDNRMVLEEIYTSLLNDINPGAIDKDTQDHLQNLCNIIKDYSNISTKRERLQFIYNQEKAAAIRNAVPNPLAVISVSNAMDWKKLAITVAYTAVDSYNNYKRASESADMAFIMSGWELDDEEKEAIRKNRERAFNYMVTMVRENNLDGTKTLNEKSIEKFAQICATENAAERIKLLKAEKETYQLLGNYWLELADAYFEISKYKECLECVDQYEGLASGIYRKDFNYLRILPKAIVATQETCSGSQYNTKAGKYADAILLNTYSDDWANRYFAAQVYLDLYSKTSKKSYLEKAYKISSENVANLLKEQRAINSAYLNDVVEQTVSEPDYRYMTENEKEDAKKEYKAEKKRVSEYNKALKETRKTELPSLYEPLVINCELMISLADKLKIDKEEKADIEAILDTRTNKVFMVKPVNDAYSFNHADISNTIEFSEDEIVIPADLLTANSKIAVTVNENGAKSIFNDCVVSKVERNGSDITDFKAIITSKKMKKHEWIAGSTVEVVITYSDVYDKTATFNFAVSSVQNHWYGDKVVFSAK